MFRKSSLVLFCAVLASTPAMGADFLFAARVSMLPSLSVSAAPAGDPASAQATLAMSGTQDRCLDVRWLDGAGTAIDPTASPDDAPTSSPFRLDGRGRATVSMLTHRAPAGTTVQITLN
ncbi:hypothetical protein KKA85_08100 [bacterium]|nr:hypothetical protein [bacterium]MBU1675727.1 hypothetical protein [bacterium]